MHNEELSKLLDLSINSISNALSVSTHDFSIDSPISNEDGYGRTMLDILPDNNQHLPDDELTKLSLEKEIEYTLSILTDREAEVIRMIFGIGREKRSTLEEIGKNFNLTRERIRQIKEKALKKLRHSKKVNNLMIYLG